MHAEQQIDQIRRRVFQGKKIPHAEKVFSLFQPRTEWISKGKSGGAVELGLRLAVVVYQHLFILYCHVMEGCPWSGQMPRSWYCRFKVLCRPRRCGAQFNFWALTYANKNNKRQIDYEAEAVTKKRQNH